MDLAYRTAIVAGAGGGAVSAQQRAAADAWKGTMKALLLTEYKQLSGNQNPVSLGDAAVVVDSGMIGLPAARFASTR